MNELIEKKYPTLIFEHYIKNWSAKYNICRWNQGPTDKLPADFCIIEFEPNEERKMWTYATCCLSQYNEPNGIELHLLSSKQDKSIIELLTAIAYYHHNSEKLDLNHTVYFGRAWQDDSHCTYGFISLPYLDGPNLEDFLAGSNHIKFYWLIPISIEEIEYKKEFGVEALEERFDEKQIDFINPHRANVV